MLVVCKVATGARNWQFYQLSVSLRYPHFCVLYFGRLSVSSDSFCVRRLALSIVQCPMLAHCSRYEWETRIRFDWLMST